MDLIHSALRSINDPSNEHGRVVGVPVQLTIMFAFGLSELRKEQLAAACSTPEWIGGLNLHLVPTEMHLVEDQALHGATVHNELEVGAHGEIGHVHAGDTELVLDVRLFHFNAFDKATHFAFQDARERQHGSPQLNSSTNNKFVVEVRALLGGEGELTDGKLVKPTESCRGKSSECLFHAGALGQERSDILIKLQLTRARTHTCWRHGCPGRGSELIQSSLCWHSFQDLIKHDPRCPWR
mmetsp:Transcript_32746/g.70201  ORF Transcript_32746/g.70201 Transcript_32746/m.70201 type:complete len:239 (-) Transcript_32746:158-874(-)